MKPISKKGGAVTRINDTKISQSELDAMAEQARQAREEIQQEIDQMSAPSEDDLHVMVR